MAKRRRRKKASKKKLRIKITDRTVWLSIFAGGLLFFAFYAEARDLLPKIPFTPPAATHQKEKVRARPVVTKPKPAQAAARAPRAYIRPKPPAEPVPAVRERPVRPVKTFRSGAPKLVFVLDDMGHTTEWLDDLKSLGPDVTYAILPFLRHSRFFDQLSTVTGAEVILHLPLESKIGTIPGPGLIRTRMSDNQVLEILGRTLSSVPHASGVNNHMGSKGTADPHLMWLILGRLKTRGYFFLDSLTTPASSAPRVSADLHYPILTRDVFLDNEDNQEKIRQKVRELAAKARLQGYGIGIGHYRYNTLKVLREEIPRLKAQGFETAALSDLLKMKSSR